MERRENDNHLDKLYIEDEITQYGGLIAKYFPDTKVDLDLLFERLLEGDIIGAIAYLLTGWKEQIMLIIRENLDFLLSILLLAFLSVLFGYLSFTLSNSLVEKLGRMYVNLIEFQLLLVYFQKMKEVSVEALNNITLFMKLLIPTYLTTVGVACGISNAEFSYQMILVLVMQIVQVLIDFAIPCIMIYFLLGIIRQLSEEGNLSMLMKMVHKIIDFILKAALWLIAGAGMFQGAISPVLSAAESGLLLKTIKAVPGVGNSVEEIAGLLLGSALVIKNCVGIFIMLGLLLFCSGPILLLLTSSVLLKITACVEGILKPENSSAIYASSEAVHLLFRTVATVTLLFMISLASVVLSLKGI